jgi:putative hydrolase of the HAD superfamily
MIKAVMFDLGGVYFEDGTNKFLKKLSDKINLPVETLYPIFRDGKSLEYRENKISGTEFFEWASIELNNQLSPEEINLMWVSEYTEIAGVRTIIDYIKSQNIRVGILSDNVPERINYLENKYHFLSNFEEIIFSYEVGLTKNDVKIFELAINRHKVLPEEILFIDDRQPNLDVASSIKIKTLLFESAAKLKTDIYNLLP